MGQLNKHVKTGVGTATHCALKFRIFTCVLNAAALLGHSFYVFVSHFGVPGLGLTPG